MKLGHGRYALIGHHGAMTPSPPIILRIKKEKNRQVIILLNLSKVLDRENVWNQSTAECLIIPNVKSIKIMAR